MAKARDEQKKRICRLHSPLVFLVSPLGNPPMDATPSCLSCSMCKLNKLIKLVRHLNSISSFFMLIAPFLGYEL